MSPYPRTALATALPLASSAGPALALLLGAGCAIPPPQVEAELTISAALALPGAVVFHEEGAPLEARSGEEPALTAGVALRRAVETSPELQAALARVRQAQAAAELAGLLPNPILDLVFRLPEDGGRLDVEAGLAADFLAVLQRPGRSRVAARRMEAEAAAALSTALDVVAEVQGRYADVQALEELVPLLDARLFVLDRLREVAQARLDLGEGTRQDVTTLDAERLELSVEAAQVRRELRLARLALARRIGEPSGAAAWQLDGWQPPRTVPAEEQAWIEVALRARPELLALQWEIRARREEAALAGWTAADGAAVSVEAERDDEWSIGPGVAVPVPLFDTGRARAGRARALESEARHRLTESRCKVVEEVRTALVELAGAQSSLERVALELVPLQERRRAELEEAYRLGHVDVTALLLADQALQESQARRVGLEREVSGAQVRLERAVGGPSAFVARVAEEAGRLEP